MKFSQKLPARLELIPGFTRALLEKVRQLGLKKEELFDIKLCLEEALINAVKHGCKLNPAHEVEVDVESAPGRLAITVKDKGEGFDFKNIPSPAKDEHLGKLSGRGIYLIRSHMDEVDFFDCGRGIKMVKFLKTGGELVQIKEEKLNDAVLCILEGEINLSNSPELRKIFDGIIKRNEKKVMVDFQGVSYIDSSGLATLIEMSQRIKKTGGSLRFCGLEQKIKNIFEVTKLNKLFEIYGSREEALKNF